MCVGKGGENYKFTSAKLLFLDPKYVWRQKCCKKRGEFRTEFTISSSKIFPEIEKYNPSTKNISYKKCWKKMGDFVHNRSEPESSWTSTPHLPCIYPKANSNKTSFSFPYSIVIPNWWLSNDFEITPKPFFFVSRVFKNEQMFQFQNFDFLSKKSVSTYFLFLKPR